MNLATTAPGHQAFAMPGDQAPGLCGMQRYLRIRVTRRPMILAKRPLLDLITQAFFRTPAIPARGARTVSMQPMSTASPCHSLIAATSSTTPLDVHSQAHSPSASCCCGIADIRLPTQLDGRGQLRRVVDEGFFKGTITAVLPDDHHVHLQRGRQCQALLGPEAAVDVEVGQCFVIGVQVQHQVGIAPVAPGSFCHSQVASCRALHGQGVVKCAVEILPTGFVKRPNNLPWRNWPMPNGLACGNSVTQPFRRPCC